MFLKSGWGTVRVINNMDMTPLILVATETTPSVNFDPAANLFSISGESRAENVRKVYEPILNWLDSFYTVCKKSGEGGAQSKGTIIIKIQFEYFNSTSSVFIMLMFRKWYEISLQGRPVEVHWYYENIDADMLLSGQRYSKLVNLPFHFFPL